MSKVIDNFLDACPSYAHIIDCSKEEYGDKPEKQELYFGCNYEDVPTVIIKWSEKGRGFGEYTFQYKNGKMICENECDSKESVKRVLCQMVDDCEFLT